MNRKIVLSIFGIFIIVSVAAHFSFGYFAKKEERLSVQERLNRLPDGPTKTEILYGYNLVTNTAELIGPKGKIKNITGTLVSCAHCHTDGGDREFALPFWDTHGSYPQYRSRENKILNLDERINSCIVMPMKGKELDKNSREMHALLLYMRWMGVDRKILPADTDNRLMPIQFPDFAASPKRGKELYALHCVRCHGENGLGVINNEGTAYVFPPLWGPDSFRFGSSMSRVTILARFILANMPKDKVEAEGKPFLTNVEALDIAAFINDGTQNPRPQPPPGKVLYPNIIFKPFDFGEGPFADSFPPDQHKYGPFGPILENEKNRRARLNPGSGDFNAP